MPQPTAHARSAGHPFGKLAGLLLVAALGYIGDRHHQNTVAMKLREHDLLPAIQAAAENHGLPAELVRAVVWKESRFDPQCVGTKGEIGLMQITGGAVQDWARVTRQSLPGQAELFQPEKNLEIGCWYLARCRNHWEGYAAQEILQLAEYNAGRTKVLKDWAPEHPETQVPLENISYPGTRSYIRQIQERREHYRRSANEF
ncbi:MAG: transglycosylase SLT domain-containing protein [Victivallales bacterium]|nr:transglycosylase SLT domain-containing protein [Victivallales bacterium]